MAVSCERVAIFSSHGMVWVVVGDQRIWKQHGVFLDHWVILRHPSAAAIKGQLLQDLRI